MAEKQHIVLKSGYILHCVLYYMYLEKTRSQSEVVHTTIRAVARSENPGGRLVVLWWA